MYVKQQKEPQRSKTKGKGDGKMEKRKTDYYGSIQPDKLWIGEKSVTIRMDKGKARKLAAALRKSVVSKKSVDLCVHLNHGSVSAVSR